MKWNNIEVHAVANIDGSLSEDGFHTRESNNGVNLGGKLSTEHLVYK